MSDNLDAVGGNSTEVSKIIENVSELQVSQLGRILVVQAGNAEDEEISEEIEIEIPLEFEKLISVEPGQIAKICRTCLSEKTEMHSLFDTWDVETLAEMLATFAAVQLTLGDGLPENICRDCVELVGKCYTFKQLCERSESMLRLLMNQGHFQAQVLKDASDVENDVQNRNIIDRVDDSIDIDNSKICEEESQQPNHCTEEIIESSPHGLEIEDSDEYKLLIADNQLTKEKRISALSVNVNPSIDIEPIIVPSVEEKNKKPKSDHGIKKSKKNKVKSPDVSIKKEVEEFDDVEVKVETDDLANDSDVSDMNTQIKEEIDVAKFQCFICQKEFPSQKKLSRHEKIHLSVKPYKCDVCGKGFNESGDLNKHKRNHKRKEEIDNGYQLIEKNVLESRLPCTQCHLTFGSQGDLDIHSAVHVDYNGKKICHHCKKQFDTTLQLKRHVRTHLSDKPYKCRICRKGFPEMSSLTRHFRRHTGETKEKKHICKHCDKAYHDRHSLNVHMRKHTGERPWICSDCGKGFIDSRLLNSHMKIHSDHKPFSCKMCDKKFKHESTLITHVRTHTGEKPYICTVCGNAFGQSSNLALHMRTHTQERPYACDQCPKRFSSSSALTTHRRIHTGEKPYSCTICQKKFARYDLAAHMRRHVGDKPHKCSVCSKKFTTVGQLNQHTRMHTGEKPFECQICKKGCTTSSYLKKHLLRAHNTTYIWHSPEDIKQEVKLTNEDEKMLKDEVTLSKDDVNHIDTNVAKDVVEDPTVKRKQIRIDNKKKITIFKVNKSQGDSNIITVNQAIEANADISNTLTAYPANVLNVVTLTPQNSNVTQGDATQGSDTVVTSTGEKIFQIDPLFLRIHHITSVPTGHVAIAEIANETEQNNI